MSLKQSAPMVVGMLCACWHVDKTKFECHRNNLPATVASSGCLSAGRPAISKMERLEALHCALSQLARV